MMMCREGVSITQHEKLYIYNLCSRYTWLHLGYHEPLTYPLTHTHTQESTVEWGSILCGYGEGAMMPSPSTSDKAVLFSLPHEDSAVFFNRELVPIFEVLAELPDGTGLLGA